MSRNNDTGWNEMLPDLPEKIRASLSPTPQLAGKLLLSILAKSTNNPSIVWSSQPSSGHFRCRNKFIHSRQWRMPSVKLGQVYHWYSGQKELPFLLHRLPRNKLSLPHLQLWLSFWRDTVWPKGSVVATCYKLSHSLLSSLVHRWWCSSIISKN